MHYSCIYLLISMYYFIEYISSIQFYQMIGYLYNQLLLLANRYNLNLHTLLLLLQLCQQNQQYSYLLVLSIDKHDYSNCMSLNLSLHQNIKIEQHMYYSQQHCLPKRHMIMLNYHQNLLINKQFETYIQYISFYSYILNHQKYNQVIIYYKHQMKILCNHYNQEVYMIQYQSLNQQDMYIYIIHQFPKHNSFHQCILNIFLMKYIQYHLLCNFYQMLNMMNVYQNLLNYLNITTIYKLIQLHPMYTYHQFHHIDKTVYTYTLHIQIFRHISYYQIHNPY